MSKQRTGLISIFAHHPVAANLLMFSMIVVGLWALTQLNVQFLPTFRVHQVTTTVVWPGASAEDVSVSITRVLEQSMRNMDYLKELRSTSRLGSSVITAEFYEGTNMSEAVERVRERVGQVERDLPSDAESPVVQKEETFERVAKLVLSAPGSVSELRALAYQAERELLDAGVSKIDITGLPDQEIAIEVSMRKLSELKLSLDQIADVIGQRSQDLPAGTVGRSDSGRQLRSLQKQRTVAGFEQLPLVTDATGQLLRVGDVGKVSLRPQQDEVRVFYKNQPAVELTLFRTESANSLKAAKVLTQWLNTQAKRLPSTVTLKVYEESWQLIKQRINLLLYNGLGGLALILIILFLMIRADVAFWVSAGIPVSFLAALAALFFLGGTINMVSLFALIMTLGIIVDDTIVVGEEIATLRSQGMPLIEAVTEGAYRMRNPIMASTLTTLCAFFPLMLIGDVIGTILFAIPLVVVCVLIASVIECFLVLPGHLRHNQYVKVDHAYMANIQERVAERFEYFKVNVFKHWVRKALYKGWITIGVAALLFVLSISFVISGWVSFTFFPSPDSTRVYAVAHLVSGTPEREKTNVLTALRQALQKTNEDLPKNGKPIVKLSLQFENYDSLNRQQGAQFVSIAAELTDPDKRTITNQQFVNTWRKNIAAIPGVENLTVRAPRGGPPGQDIDIELRYPDVTQLKKAAVALRRALHAYAGVSNIQDNMPYGQQQLIYTLNAQGRALGLTTTDVGRQIRAAYSGQIAQIYHVSNDEIEVRVLLPDEERNQLLHLNQLPIVVSQSGVRDTVPLSSVVTLSTRQGIDVLRNNNARLSARVTAEVDATQTNANRILQSVREKVMPDLIKKYAVSVQYKGRSEEQADTLDDMKYGLMLALVLIYIVLAWVFSSYGWPFLVMLAMPLGLTGAIFGHVLMGLDLTILSLFGFFGLTGIVINDSIILITRYRELKHSGMGIQEAIIEASCQRLRAVTLTSLTTIAGLTPLLFETSLQAQFLIPMATSLSFGIAYATVLILIVIPTALYIYEQKRSAQSSY